MKTALVTGGTKGIGKAISERLENIGYKVISADRTMGDLSTSEGINQLVSHVDGKLDLLVNNAAFTKYIDYKDLDSLDDDLYDKIFHVLIFHYINSLKLLIIIFTNCFLKQKDIMIFNENKNSWVRWVFWISISLEQKWKDKY